MATWGRPRDRTVLSVASTFTRGKLWLYICPFPVVPFERGRKREKGPQLDKRIYGRKVLSLSFSLTLSISLSQHPSHTPSLPLSYPMSNTYALLQYDGDPLRHRFIDHEGRLAFTM